MKSWKDLTTLEKLAVRFYYGKQQYIQRHIREYHAKLLANLDIERLDQWTMRPKK